MIDHGGRQIGPRPICDAGGHIRAAIGDAGERRQKISVTREKICIARQEVRVRHRVRRRGCRPRRSRQRLNKAWLSWLRRQARRRRLGWHRDGRHGWRVWTHARRNHRGRGRTSGGGCSCSNMLDHNKSSHRKSGRFCHPFASHKVLPVSVFSRLRVFLMQTSLARAVVYQRAPCHPGGRCPGWLIMREKGGVHLWKCGSVHE